MTDDKVIQALTSSSSSSQSQKLTDLDLTSLSKVVSKLQKFTLQDRSSFRRKFILDTGVIRYIICQKAYFQSFLTCEETVSQGSTSSMKVEGSGLVFIRFLDTGFVLPLKDYLFMPSLGLNLISTSKLQNYQSLITSVKALLFNNKGRLLIIGDQVKGLYHLPV